MHFCEGSVIPQTQHGWAAPPPKDRHILLPKVKGRREGVKDVAEESVRNNATEQQGEVALASVVCVMVA